MSETLTVPVTEVGHIFYRTDEHARKSRPTGEHTLQALRQWLVKALQRTAREADCGLAYMPPMVDTVRDSSARRTEYIVWTKYALLPGRAGQVHVIRRDPHVLTLVAALRRQLQAD